VRSLVAVARVIATAQPEPAVAYPIRSRRGVATTSAFAARGRSPARRLARGPANVVMRRLRGEARAHSAGQLERLGGA